jgi:hypothetical protein
VPSPISTPAERLAFAASAAPLPESGASEVQVPPLAKDLLPQEVPAQ